MQALRSTLILLATVTAMLVATPRDASAFCGFYVSGADAELYADATMVVMMRQGTKTVLSMRNTYQGPPKDFAMVVPVPEVLQEENVKTLRDEVFDRVDKLAAPRLVEYWEQDPCGQNRMRARAAFGGLGAMGKGRGGGGAAEGNAVKVEAEFDVGEYNIVVLSATESNSLEKWLTQNKYNIPDGAAPLFKPYIEQGQYFFVAKVDPKKITFNAEGRAELSPLRFHYESEDFQLPVRLGLINARGEQDLIVHILSDKRYKVANRPNVTIPTNLVVKDAVRERFPHFYTTLFDRTLEEHPGAVVTEYSWNASSCDPCPTPALRYNELMELGQDVVNDQAGGATARGRRVIGMPMGRGMVLTRLHARYTAEGLDEDLVFEEAEPIVGGRGMPYGLSVLEDGVIGEQRAIPGRMNNFQGRYIMLNKWEGEISCENPRRGQWGGPPGGGARETKAAEDTAFVPRGEVNLTSVMVTKEIAQFSKLGADDGAIKDAEEAKSPQDVEEAKSPAPPVPPKKPEAAKQCAAAPADRPGESWWLLGLLGVLWLGRRRR